ncbi:MAG TPA: SLBB domain-containing protein [Vicinamibacterales bacterium]|nr:SLBB domain-containing protein [Vicinamibacterales bacterium]
MKAGLLASLLTLLVGTQLADAPAYRVLVTGEVRYPGRATLTASTMTVADALAAVGSPTQAAGDDVMVIRWGRDGERADNRVIAIRDVDLGTPGVDVTLRDGDIVNVPPAKRFYISGFVKRAGVYKLPAGMTVAQAITLAGGLSAGGNDRRIKIARVVNAKTVDVAAELADKILPNDEIKVPRKMF